MAEIVVFAPHPDDAELGMGGTIARHTAAGHRVVICDLTRGEMGSAGTPELRQQEGDAAAHILGAERINLGLPDRGLFHGAGGLGAGGEQLRRCVEAIRQLQPRVVAFPWREDIHPDHVAAHHLLHEAVFTAGLRRYDTGQPAHRVERTVCYLINGTSEPSFVIDISAWQQRKAASLAAYRSQFSRDGGQPATRLNAPTGLLYLVEARDRYLGARIGVAFAEGFITPQPPVLHGLL